MSTANASLEERWRHLVHTRGRELAVHDQSSGESWSFAQLEAQADARPAAAERGLCFPRGRGVGFLLEVLRAWRAGLPICPVEADQPPPPVPVPQGNIALLKRTSGSTGTPQTVAMTGGEVAAGADHIVGAVGLGPSHPNLAVVSMAHSYGFSNLVTPLLLHGIPLILVASALPEAVAAAARDWPGAILPAVPALWRAWQDSGGFPPGIHLAISAGAPLPLPLEAAVLKDRGLKIHNFLGASECGGIAYDQSAGMRPDGFVVGTALEGVGLSADAGGCLIVSGPAVASGYWPESDPRLSPGRFCTSDLVSIAPGGLLRVHGRAGDLINVAGRKVAPETVEQALLAHPDVVDCLVFGVPDSSGRGEGIGVVYVIRKETSEPGLRRFLADHLSAWEIPRHWWRRADLNADGRGKRSRTAWRVQLTGAERASPVADQVRARSG